MQFEKLDIIYKNLYEHYTNKQYQCSEASFSNMYIWRNETNVYIKVIEDMLVLRVFIDGKYKFVMPFGDANNYCRCIKELYNLCKASNIELIIIGADYQFINSIKDLGLDFTYEQDRNAQDYIYLSENLSALSGKKLHSKRNHVNKFKSLYTYEYVDLKENMLDECFEKTKAWMHSKYEGNQEKYKKELLTLKDLFENFSYFNLFGGAIYIEGTLIAYSIGEYLSNDTALIHVEKADTDYEGSFAIINYEFANRLKANYKYINREEDMGIEGLRKAKLSYRPEYLTDKLICVFK